MTLYLNKISENEKKIKKLESGCGLLDILANEHKQAISLGNKTKFH